MKYFIFFTLLFAGCLQTQDSKETDASDTSAQSDVNPIDASHDSQDLFDSLDCYGLDFSACTENPNCFMLSADLHENSRALFSSRHYLRATSHASFGC